jgi:hypothetical protein
MGYVCVSEYYRDGGVGGSRSRTSLVMVRVRRAPGGLHRQVWPGTVCAVGVSTGTLAVRSVNRSSRVA